MKNFINTALLLILLSMIGACSSDTAYREKERSASENMKGEYSFEMWDTSGVKVCEGTLNITMPDSENVKGTIKIDKVHKENFPGLMAIGSKIVGKYYKQTDMLSIDTNPVVTDNNVFINAKPSAGSLNGTWSYSTIAGERNKGKFKAVKK